MTIYRLVLLGSLLVAILVLTAACGAESRGNATQPASQATVVPESPADTATPVEISEPPPTAMPTIELETTATPTSAPSPTLEPTATAAAEALASPTPEPQPTETATPEPTATDTPLPAQPIAILSGELKGVGGDYTGSGLATIYQQDGGDRTLEFTEFSVTRGPGLVVLLSNNPDVHLTRNIGQYVELGDLQDFTGDQAYQIPADLDLSEYSVAVIYCKPFDAVFATVTLQ
jgi:cytoskeletal protein RodZ